MRGGSLATATAGGAAGPDAASDASSRSRDTVRWLGPSCVLREKRYSSPLSGSVGNSRLVTTTSSSRTMREALSTWVRAFAKITPNTSSFGSAFLIAIAERNVIVLPIQDSTCGW